MPIIKCKMCGGDLEIREGQNIGVCQYCGSTMTLPKIDDEQRAAAFNRGNHFRRIGEFDKALQVYERIVREEENDAEAHWCCALCRFGIEYVEDPTTYEWLPTCHRASFDNFLEDVDYLAAVEHSDGVTKKQYIRDGAKIAEVQRGILATSQNEEPYDVFICYKETDENGDRTRDSALAQDIYYQLTELGRRVFFARITLEDKAGAEFEPYIFAALQSARVMVVVGTSAENLNAVWVKNEWSRFLAMMKHDRNKLLLPCYRDMDPYDLPDQLGVLQSYDMSKIGFIQDLTRGIAKVLEAEEAPEPVKETVVVQQMGSNLESLLDRGNMALEDREWDKADGFFEEVLNQNSRCAEAYVGKLMAQLSAKNWDDLQNTENPFDDRNDYQKAIRFADEKLRKKLSSCIALIKAKNEEKRLADAYSRAQSSMKMAESEADYKRAARQLQSISSYKDAAALAQKCMAQAETARKNAIYEKAKAQMSGEYADSYEKAIEVLKTIPGWKDSDQLIFTCQNKILEIQDREEQQRQERERQAELRRQKIEKNKKQRKAAVFLSIIVLCIGIAFAIVLKTVMIPQYKLKKSYEFLNAGDFETAYALMEEVGRNDAIKESKFKRACEFLNAGDFETAYALMEEAGRNDAIKESKYKRACEFLDAGDFETAYALMEEAGRNDAIKENKYNRANTLIESGDYISAHKLLEGNDYKDSEDIMLRIKPEYHMALIENAQVGDELFFGTYEQDNNAANGEEDIEWLVLDIEDEKMLVISKYALDCKPYHQAYENTTWETCALRKWLNEDFIRDAFSADEQKRIPVVMVSAEQNPTYNSKPGNDTSDQIFLMSISEVEKHFRSDTISACIPTPYAVAQNAYEAQNGNCWWWLRSPAYNQKYAAGVGYSGNPDSFGHKVILKSMAVRPAMWISLEP